MMKKYNELKRSFYARPFITAFVFGLTALAAVVAFQTSEAAGKGNTDEGFVRPGEHRPHEKNFFKARPDGAVFNDDLASEVQKILAPDGAQSDFFGYSIAVSGNTAIIGAYNESHGATNDEGAAYIFIKSGGQWVFQQKLIAPDGVFADEFGFSVAISGNTAVVGAPKNKVGSNNEQGSAYVFVRSGTTWSIQQKLTAGDGATNDQFGYSVGIDGNRIIVGAHRAVINHATGAGAVYIFNRTGSVWTQQQKIYLVSGGEGDRFGTSVAISGNSVFIGATGDTNAQYTAPGAAYVFNYNPTTTNWGLHQKLVSPNRRNNDQMGRSIAVDGDVLVVGATENYPTGSYPPSRAYVFHRNGTTWSHAQTLSASDGANDNNFGMSVAVSGNKVLVGAPGVKINSAIRGAAYLFVKNGAVWQERRKFTAVNVNDQVGHLGSGVSVAGDELLIGDYYDDIGSNVNQGSVYVYRSGSAAPFDYDGDGKTDVSIFRPQTGEWWFQRSSDNSGGAVQFGTSTDKMVPGDYTGDGKTDFAFFRPSTGSWFVLRSEDSSFYGFQFGGAADIPVPGDFDGDGRTDAAVFRPSNATWYILRSSDGGVTIQQFGAGGDRPVTADYDGDGMADIGIYRPSVSEWWILRSSLGLKAVQFGASGDKAVPGDYTGDGRADIAFWRPSNGYWYVLRSEDDTFYAFPFGSSADIPAPGDYDGDGRMDAAVFRSSNATWYISGSTAGVSFVPFGSGSDIPVPNAYVR